MITQLIHVWSATWPVHDQSRDQCMTSQVISAWDEKVKTDVGPQGLYGKMWKMWKTLSQTSVSNNNTITIYLTPEIHLISSWHLSRDMVPLDREVFNLCFLSLWSELFPALWKPGHFNQFGWLSGTKFAGYHICPHLVFWPEAGACYENRSGWGTAELESHLSH